MNPVWTRVPCTRNSFNPPSPNLEQSVCYRFTLDSVNSLVNTFSHVAEIVNAFVHTVNKEGVLSYTGGRFTYGDYRVLPLFEMLFKLNRYFKTSLLHGISLMNRVEEY